MSAVGALTPDTFRPEQSKGDPIHVALSLALLEAKRECAGRDKRLAANEATIRELRTRIRFLEKHSQDDGRCGTMTTVAQPKYSTDLQNAVERTLGQHDLRLKPGIMLDTVLETLKANQCDAELQHGQLALTQHGQPIHTPKAIEGLAKQRSELFYPRNAEVGAVKSRDQLDQKGKVEFIRQHGLTAFERLPQTAPLETVVTLDPSRMTRAQWLSLSRAQKSDALKAWPSGALERVMARTK